MSAPQATARVVPLSESPLSRTRLTPEQRAEYRLVEQQHQLDQQDAAYQRLAAWIATGGENR